jgi:hypothetical protein
MSPYQELRSIALSQSGDGAGVLGDARGGVSAAEIWYRVAALVAAIYFAVTVF